MKRVAFGSLVAFAMMVAAGLLALFTIARTGVVRADLARPVTAARPTVDGLVTSVMPKASMEVVEGEKTVAPAVPAPITRTQSKIVEYTLTARETAAQIAPNVNYLSLWTFDGVAPGPVMRVRQGDVIRFTLRSESKNVTNHNIDLHFISGACGGCGDTRVKPGESKTIEVRALYPGLFMYHCAYNQEGNIPAVHIANGMYGFLIMDPITPLPPVAHEFILVESEFYAEKAGKNAAACSYSALTAEIPTHVFFNGHHADLTPPLVVRTGERTRIYFGRGGVNGWSAFHIIGAIFDKVYQDGGTLDAPAEHGIQTVSVPVGGATIVEFVPLVRGTLTAVDHNLSRVFFKGLGQVIKVEGDANPEIYQAMEPAKIVAPSTRP